MIPGEHETVLGDDQIQPGSVIADRYLVKRVLGAGSMGTVCLATDQMLNDTVVALKILQAHLTRDALSQKRFIREVELMNSVSHPNVVRTYEAGVHKGRTYFTMEFVHGVSIDQLALNTVLNIDILVDLIIQICRGLDAVHKQGIIHRDLKPENILVTEDLVPKIADFGVSRRQSSKLTHAEAIIGSPGYLAPEVWQGLEPTQAIDFYALGVILFEITTQTVLFDSDQPVSLMWMHINKLPPRIRDIAPEFPQWLDDLVWSMLSKHPLDRPASAEAIIEYIMLSLEREKNHEAAPAIGTLTNERPGSERSETSALPLPPTGWEPIPMAPEPAQLIPDCAAASSAPTNEKKAPPFKESVSAIFAKERKNIVKKIVVFGLAALASSVILLICALIIEAVGSLSDREPKVKPPWADLREQYKDKAPEEKQSVVASLFTPDLWKSRQKEKPKNPWADLSEQFPAKPEVTQPRVADEPRPQPPVPTQSASLTEAAQPTPINPPWAGLVSRFVQSAGEPAKMAEQPTPESPAVNAPGPQAERQKTPWADLRSPEEKAEAQQPEQQRSSRPIRDLLFSILPGAHRTETIQDQRRALIRSLNAKGTDLSYSAAASHKRTEGALPLHTKPASPAELVPPSAKNPAAQSAPAAVRWFEKGVAAPTEQPKTFRSLVSEDGTVNIGAVKQRFDLPQESVADVVQLAPDAIAEMYEMNLEPDQEQQLTAKLELRMKSSELKAQVFALDNPWPTKRATLEWQLTGQLKRIEEAKSYLTDQLSSTAKLYTTSVKEFEGLNAGTAVEIARRHSSTPTVQSMVSEFDQLSSSGAPVDTAGLEAQRTLILQSISPILEADLAQTFIVLANLALLLDSLEFAAMQTSYSLEAIRKPVTAEPEHLKIERDRLAENLALNDAKLLQLSSKLSDRQETLLRVLAIAYRYSS